MVEDHGGIDATRVADLERVQVGLQRVPEEYGRGRRGEHGEDVRLYLLEGGSCFAESLRGDARPSASAVSNADRQRQGERRLPCQIIHNGLSRLHELVVDHDSRRILDEAYAGELLALFRHTLM